MVATRKEKDVVCGNVGDNFVLIVRSEALRLATIHKAISDSKTWGDFKEKLRPENWRQVLKRLDYPSLANYRDEEGFASDEEARVSYNSLPLGEREPVDSDPFEADSLPGFTDGDWPEWPAQQALKWVPRGIQRRFGESISSVINGPFLQLDPSRATEIIAAMRTLGYACERNDALVRSASGD